MYARRKGGNEADQYFGDAVRDLLDPGLRGGAGRYGRKVKKGGEVKREPRTKK